MADWSHLNHYRAQRKITVVDDNDARRIALGLIAAYDRADGGGWSALLLSEPIPERQLIGALAGVACDLADEIAVYWGSGIDAAGVLREFALRELE